MLRGVVALAKGAFSGTVLAANVLTVFSGMVPFALAKLSLPQGAARRAMDRILCALVEAWTGVNGWWMALVQRTRWDVEGLEGVRRRGWYLVSSNHQSWVDILVLQKVLHRKAPFPKFFLKRELLYVPVLGLAWWALDFPFMRRRGGADRARDLEATRRACERFRRAPTALVNFLEGTRFTGPKHARQGSPFRHLLKPRVGGLAAALGTLGERAEALLDITIVYPRGVPSFWDLMCGRMHEVVVRVRELEIPADLREGDEQDPDFRSRVQAWVNRLWEEKDRRIGELLGPGLADAAG